MSIQGNVVGNIAPRADFAQTDPTKPDYIKNKPDTAAIKKTAEEAKKAADGALPITGGTMTGALTIKGMYLTGGVDYGDTFPVEGLTDGRLFFIDAESAAAAELG